MVSSTSFILPRRFFIITLGERLAVLLFNRFQQSCKQVLPQTTLFGLRSQTALQPGNYPEALLVSTAVCGGRYFRFALSGPSVVRLGGFVCISEEIRDRTGILQPYVAACAPPCAISSMLAGNFPAGWWDLDLTTSPV